jgi:hypothetical protein
MKPYIRTLGCSALAFITTLIAMIILAASVHGADDLGSPLMTDGQRHYALGLVENAVSHQAIHDVGDFASPRSVAAAHEDTYGLLRRMCAPTGLLFRMVDRVSVRTDFDDETGAWRIGVTVYWADGYPPTIVGYDPECGACWCGPWCGWGGGDACWVGHGWCHDRGHWRCHGWRGCGRGGHGGR